MRPRATIRDETLLTSDPCVTVPETGRYGNAMMTEPIDVTGLVADERPLIEPNTAIRAPELIARVRASLRAKNQIMSMRRSRLDAE
jgi:hypothetical protein